VIVLLLGNRARKGVFITSSWFSSDAVSYAQGLDSKIALINGAALVNHMIDADFGVSVSRSYEVQRTGLGRGEGGGEW
jgi:restriction system protein